MTKPPLWRGPTASEDQLRVICEPRAEQAVASELMESESRAWVKRLPLFGREGKMTLVRAVAVFALLSLTASAESQEPPSQAPQVQTEQQPNSAAEREPQRTQKTNAAEEQTTIVQPNAADNTKGKADRDTHQSGG
jgi:hypothetical protein